MNGLELVPGGKVLKIFIVELDDDNRERVLSGLISYVELKNDPDYETVESDYRTVHTFKTQDNVTLTAKMVPREDGTYFTIENFLEPEDEEEWENEGGSL